MNTYLGYVMTLLGLYLLACEDSHQDSTSSPVSTLSAEDILNPQTCQPCHPTHYQQWQGSMHAYASNDPVFRALNQKGQRDTSGELGSFCVQCHAPLALQLGYTTDGLNLEQVPEEMQGITCAFCHQVSAVEGTHNNPLRWTEDGVMRGGLSTVQENDAHRSIYSPIHDGKNLASSDLCGSCHDIVTPLNIHLEQTYAEWQDSLFNDDDPSFANSCNACHMPTQVGQVAISSSREGQRIHNHLMPGVDVHVEDHEHREMMMDAVQNSLNSSLIGEICVRLGEESGAEVELYLENIAAGHRFPSGAALDRRVWVSLEVFDENQNIVFSSGQVDEDEPVVDAMSRDENLWAFFDQAYNASGERSHHFWEIARVERNTLPMPTNILPIDSAYEEPHVMKRYRFATDAPVHHIQMRVFIRPMALELLQELVESGDLSDTVLRYMPTFELSYAARYWDLESAERLVPVSGKEALCVR